MNCKYSKGRVMNQRKGCVGMAISNKREVEERERGGGEGGREKERKQERKEERERKRERETEKEKQNGETEWRPLEK
jgi:hypothetical protein